jgi:hypothetical protein
MLPELGLACTPVALMWLRDLDVGEKADTELHAHTDAP